MNEHVIRGDGIAFHFGEGDLRKQILHGVDVRTSAGEIVLLTGPSGSGKTTLLTLIGGLRSMQAGALTVLGHDLSTADDAARVSLRRRVGYIFQAHNLLGFLTARQNVELSLELHPEIPTKERPARAEASLREVGLGDKLDAYPAKLSGGQKQRVAVARAIVGGPELILADEPTASLDRDSGAEVAGLLERLARERGCGVLLVTHDERVHHIADRALRMEDGRMVA